MTQARRVVDVVRDMIPFMRNSMSGNERDLAAHLRGNEILFNALINVLRARLEGRANLSVPSDPIKSHSRVVADSELHWLINRLTFIYKSPVMEPTDRRDEPPA